MNRTFPRGCLAALMLVSTGVGAQDAMDRSTPNGAIAGRWYVSPMVSMTLADDKRNTADGTGGALLEGKAISPRGNLEGHLFFSGFDGEDGGGDFDLGALGFDVIGFPFDNGLFGIAGLALGSGDADVQSGNGSALNDDNEDSVVLDAGLGYLVGPFAFLNDGGLRLEARARFDQRTDSGLDDLVEPVISAGLLVPFGEPAGAASVVVPAGSDLVPAAAAADADGDGVPDDLDQCPDTPAGVAVDAVGCPLPPPTATEVPAGDQLNLGGAGAGDSFVLRGVNFEFNQATLTAEAKTILDGVVQSLQDAPEIKVEVAGHADGLGTDQYNQALSERRAQTVVRYLKGGGVDPARMRPAGYGEAKPVADNESEEGRAKNRRVELVVTEGGK